MTMSFRFFILKVKLRGILFYRFVAGENADSGPCMGLKMANKGLSWADTRNIA